MKAPNVLAESDEMIQDAIERIMDDTRWNDGETITVWVVGRTIPVIITKNEQYEPYADTNVLRVEYRFEVEVCGHYEQQVCDDYELERYDSIVREAGALARKAILKAIQSGKARLVEVTNE